MDTYIWVANLKEDIFEIQSNLYPSTENGDKIITTMFF